MKKLVNISKNQISSMGVQSLADRPNANAQYGVGGLSSTQLKLWFDKLASFLAEKINELQIVLASNDAADYIRIPLDTFGVGSLKDLVDSFENGDFASKILRLKANVSAEAPESLQAIIYAINIKLTEVGVSLSTSESAQGGTMLNLEDAAGRTLSSTPIKIKGNYDIADKTVTAGQIADKTITADQIADRAIKLSNLNDSPNEVGHIVNNAFVNVNYNPQTGKLNFYRGRGTFVSIDLPTERIVTNGRYDSYRKRLVLTLIDGSVLEIPLSDLIDQIQNVDIVQETGNSKTTVMSQKAVTDALTTMRTYIDEQLNGVEEELQIINEGGVA